MMSLTFGLFTQVSGSGPLGPLVLAGGRGGGGLNKLSLDNHFSYYYLELWPFEIFIIMNLLGSFPEKCSS